MTRINQPVDRAKLKYLFCFIVLSLFLLLGAWQAFAQGPGSQPQEYRSFFGFDSRISVWIVAELHLMFAAFILGVPMFAVI
ncbi:MAG: hypothetical protein ACE5I1_13870, partial [bacterium]